MSDRSLSNTSGPYIDVSPAGRFTTALSASTGTAARVPDTFSSACNAGGSCRILLDFLVAFLGERRGS